MERTPAALEAVKAPPSCLDGFVTSARPLEEAGLDLNVDFDLKCLHCREDVFRILCFPIIAPDPSPYNQIKPGQVVYRPPYHLQCVACDARVPLFDVRTQGYDAIMNDVDSYESGEDGDIEQSVTGQFKVMVAVCYNAELDELQEMAAEKGVNSSDLFDWLTIIGTPIGEGVVFEEGYECA